MSSVFDEFVDSIVTEYGIKGIREILADVHAGRTAVINVSANHSIKIFKRGDHRIHVSETFGTPPTFVDYSFLNPLAEAQQ